MTSRLAWRNLWRNKRRSAITMAMVFLAVILSSLMMSLKDGIYDNMISSTMGTFTGYAQVHAKGYWDDKSLDLSLALSDEQQQKLLSHPNVTGLLPRIQTGVLAASDSITRFSMVVGINPELEEENAQLSERVSTGSYLTSEDQAILVGAGLADYLEVTAGDTLVMLGQGYHGANAAGKYVIKGLIHFGSPELSNRLIILPIKEAQWLFNMEGLNTGMIIRLRNPDKVEKTCRELAGSLGHELEIMSWQDMNPELVRMIETDTIEGYVFMVILYIVISFGLFGTMLMMLAERSHEFGVLVAIGMRRIRLATMVWMEMCILSVMGAIAGMVGAVPVCAWFYYNPISLGDEMKDMVEEYGIEAVIQSSINPTIFLQHGVIVFFLSTLIAIYPLIKLSGLSAIKAMKS
ncbi:MAG: ABC transporter permease [Flavobacteriales bacterium]|nr:ABC transporter permease [Flavobacteriales bacterium]